MDAMGMEFVWWHESTFEVERISAAAKHLGIDGDVVPFGSHTNTLPGISGGVPKKAVKFSMVHFFLLFFATDIKKESRNYQTPIEFWILWCLVLLLPSRSLTIAPEKVPKPKRKV